LGEVETIKNISRGQQHDEVVNKVGGKMTDFPLLLSSVGLPIMKPNLFLLGAGINHFGFLFKSIFLRPFLRPFF